MVVKCDKCGQFYGRTYYTHKCKVKPPPPPPILIAPEFGYDVIVMDVER